MKTLDEIEMNKNRSEEKSEYNDFTQKSFFKIMEKYQTYFRIENYKNIQNIKNFKNITKVNPSIQNKEKIKHKDEDINKKLFQNMIADSRKSNRRCKSSDNLKNSKEEFQKKFSDYKSYL